MTWVDVLDTLTEEQKEGMEKLRKLLIEECTPKMLEDDALFYRFMKARDFNLKNAEDMLRKHIAWRKEYQIDTITTDYEAPEVLGECAPITSLGYDKDGDLVKYLDVGRSDPKGLMKSAKKFDIMKFNFLQLEKDLVAMKERSWEIGRPLRKIFYIINFEEITFAKATNKFGLEVLISLAKMYQDNYPERIKCMIFLNGSIYLTLLYSVLQPFLAPAMDAKVQVHGSGGYKEALLELIDADVLPGFLGGNRTDPDGDPNCRSFIKWAGKIDEKYYFRKSENQFSTFPGVKEVTVTRFAKTDVQFDVTKPNSMLEWEFETKSRDIGFGVYFKQKDSSEEESKPVELVPKQRIDTCMEIETGMCRCEKAGTYIIEFDNSYSWLYPKEVLYRARIVEPGDEENSPWT